MVNVVNGYSAGYNSVDDAILMVLYGDKSDEQFVVTSKGAYFLAKLIIKQLSEAEAISRSWGDVDVAKKETTE